MPYKDPEVRRARCKEYHTNHREDILVRQKRRHALNREHDNQVKRDWYDAHPEAKARSIDRLEEWAKVHKGRRYRRLMQANDPRRVCSKCGTTIDVCVHHVDGNHDNESPDNLQWLCRSCHAKLHNELRRSKSEEHQVPV